MNTRPFTRAICRNLQRHTSKHPRPLQIFTCTHGANFKPSTTTFLRPYSQPSSAPEKIMQTVRNTVAENLGGSSNTLAQPEDRFTLDEVPNLSGKVAVVTGGTEGIGYANSITLLKHGIKKLFIISRSAKIYTEFQQQVRELVGEDALGRVVWKECELSDASKVAQIANEIANETDRVDVLINGAGRGIMTYQLSETENIDLHTSVNLIGHVILTSILLPIMKKTAEVNSGDMVRIVNISSNMHDSAVPKDVKFASIEELNTDLGPDKQYGRSKLAVLLYARWLAEALRKSHPNILVNAVHPGVVATRQSQEHVLEPYPVLGHLVRALKPVKKDVFDAAISSMYCATATLNSGEYVCPPRIVEKGSEMSNDTELAESMMKLTKQILDSKSDLKSIKLS